MITITMQEYETMKVYETPNVLYNLMISELIKAVHNEMIAKRIIEKQWHKTLRQVSANSYFDVIKLIRII